MQPAFRKLALSKVDIKPLNGEYSREQEMPSRGIVCRTLFSKVDGKNGPPLHIFLISADFVQTACE
jgi:hypothetical protein